MCGRLWRLGPTTFGMRRSSAGFFTLWCAPLGCSATTLLAAVLLPCRGNCLVRLLRASQDACCERSARTADSVVEAGGAQMIVNAIMDAHRLPLTVQEARAHSRREPHREIISTPMGTDHRNPCRPHASGHRCLLRTERRPAVPVVLMPPPQVTLWAAAELVRSSTAGRRQISALCELLERSVEMATARPDNPGLQAAACSVLAELLRAPWGFRVKLSAQARAGSLAMDGIAAHRRHAGVLKQALAVLASLASISADFLADPEQREPLVEALGGAMEEFTDKPEIQAVRCCSGWRARRSRSVLC